MSSIKNNVDEDIITGIKNMLDTHNPYAQKFRMTRDKLDSSAVCDLKLKLISDRQTDGRLYNLPNASEVAALIVVQITEISSLRSKQTCCKE